MSACSLRGCVVVVFFSFSKLMFVSTNLFRCLSIEPEQAKEKRGKNPSQKVVSQRSYCIPALEIFKTRR